MRNHAKCHFKVQIKDINMGVDSCCFINVIEKKEVIVHDHPWRNQNWFGEITSTIKITNFGKNNLL